MYTRLFKHLFTGIFLILTLVFLAIACSEQEVPSLEQLSEAEEVLPEEEAQAEETDGTQPSIHAEVSLPGSDFEIDQSANLRNDGGGSSIDWVDVNEIRKTDKPSGQNDDSFGNGTKEDTAVPSVVDGSIPPNKSDLKSFGVYQEENASGNFLHLFWTRVQEPNGTTNMDFEFNQSSVLSANNVTPVRTPDDLLIVYELGRGGTVPELYLFTWLEGSEGLSCDSANSFPCWGDRIDLDAAGVAAGSVNTVLIPANESDGLGALSPFTFGEATVNLDFIFDPNKCESFGSAYLKSRSSDSFTAALKDFIAPASVNITNCGNVIIRKETNPDEDPNAAVFSFTTNLQTDPPITSPSFDLMDDGSKQFTNAIFGSYTVTEDNPAGVGYKLESINCSASVGETPVVDLANRKVTFNIDDPADIVDCTFTNQALGEIVIIKETVDGDGTFEFTSSALNPSPFELTTVSGTADTSFGDLIPGIYDVAETNPGPEFILISATCDDGSDPSAISLDPGETVTCTFTNERNIGAIKVMKQAKNFSAGGLAPLAGATFEINAQEVVTGANGEACVEGLVVGQTYTVTEIAAPDGYAPADPASQDVLVTQFAECGSGSEDTVTFENIPLSEVTVSFSSLAGPGVTAASIECSNANGEVVPVGGDATPGEFDDDAETFTNLPEGTYTCIIIVDP